MTTSSFRLPAGPPCRRRSRRTPSGLGRGLVLSLGVVAATLAGAGGLEGQAPPTDARPPGSAATWEGMQVAPPEITPRGAFLRSLVVPGWGHLAADAPGRAGFYVAVQGGAWWMLGKSLLRQRSASRFRESELDFVREELRAGGVMNADSLRIRAASDPRVARWDELVDIRGGQVEDWVALTLFLSLLGATDALVSAHMADYPEPLTFSVAPSPGASLGARRWDLGIRLPLGGSVLPGMPHRETPFRAWGARP